MERDIQRPVEPGDVGQIGQRRRPVRSPRRRPGNPRHTRRAPAAPAASCATKRLRHGPEERLADQRLDGRKGGGERAAKALRDMMPMDAQTRFRRHRIAHDAPPRDRPIARRRDGRRRPPADHAARAASALACCDHALGPRRFVEQHSERRNVGVPFDQGRPRAVAPHASPNSVQTLVADPAAVIVDQDRLAVASFTAWPAR